MSATEVYIPDYDLATIQQIADPAGYISGTLRLLPPWLSTKAAQRDYAALGAFLHDAMHVAKFTRERDFSRPVRLNAAEIQRRAEYAVGTAMLAGQAAGELAMRGDTGGRHILENGMQHSYKAFGVKKDLLWDVAPLAAAFPAEADFEAAVQVCRQRGVLSRIKLRRCAEPSVHDDDWVPSQHDRSPDGSARRRDIIRDMAASGHSSRQISEVLGTNSATIRRIALDNGVVITADSVMALSRHINSDRVVRETVHALEGAALGIDLVDPQELNREEIRAWRLSLASSVRRISKLIQDMKEVEAQ